MRLQNRMPLNLLVSEEALRRYRLAPTVAGLRHAGRRVGRHSLHQKPRSLVQARIAQVQLLEFRLRPGRRFGDQGVRSKAESKRETPTVYKRCSMSLKVNELSRCRGATATLCITTWAGVSAVTNGCQTAQAQQRFAVGAGYTFNSAWG